MAGEDQSIDVRPIPKFHFQVKWGDKEMSFQEVSGLDIETQVIEYRAGNNPVFFPAKMPGLVKSGNVNMKKGIYKEDNEFWEWYSQIKMNTIKRKTVVISLLDQEGNPAMAWTLTNAWPTKITGTDLKADGNETAIETIEIVHEGLEISLG